MTFALPANDFKTDLPSWHSNVLPGPGSLPPKDAQPGFASLVLRLRLALRRDPDPNRLALLDQILDVAAMSEQRLLEQEERIAELEAISITDDLTGLPNRRAFEHYMNRELQRARRQTRGGMLGFIDLDGFKGINDRFGHAAGDATLRHVAEHLRQAARSEDFVARLHGDEFVLALPLALREQAEKRFSMLCQTVEEAPLLWQEKRIPIGLSFGLVEYDGQADLAQLLEQSDLAMYRQKRARSGTR